MIPSPPVIVCTKLPVVCVPIVIKLSRVVAPVPPFVIGTVPVRISAPSIVTTPALERANVVSEACPNCMAVNSGESSVPTPRAEAAAEADVEPVPPFATGTVPVRISEPSIVTTPALERANVVSDACPNSIAVNWGESSVPTPRADAAVEADPEPVPPRAIESVPILTLLAFN